MCFRHYCLTLSTTLFNVCDPDLTCAGGHRSLKEKCPWLRAPAPHSPPHTGPQCSHCVVASQWIRFPQMSVACVSHGPLLMSPLLLSKPPPSAMFSAVSLCCSYYNKDMSWVAISVSGHWCHGRGFCCWPLGMTKFSGLGTWERIPWRAFRLLAMLRLTPTHLAESWAYFLQGVCSELEAKEGEREGWENDAWGTSLCLH